MAEWIFLPEALDLETVNVSPTALSPRRDSIESSHDSRPAASGSPTTSMVQFLPEGPIRMTPRSPRSNKVA